MATAAVADERALVLTQDSDVAGRQEVFISSSALKMINKRDGVTLLAKAPLWNIALFNTKTRVIFETAESRWAGASIDSAVAIGERTADLLVKKEVGMEKILDLPASHATLDMVKPFHAFRGADYWILKDRAYSQHLCRIMQKYYLVPLDPGVPLRYIRHNDLVDHSVLNTTTSQRKIFPAAFWAMPTGFRSVTNPGMVIYNTDEKQELIKDLIRDSNHL